MALITAAEARLYIPALSNTGEDTNINTLVSAAGVAIARYLGYKQATSGAAPTIESTAYTEYLYGPGGVRLQLSAYPIISVTSIEDDPTEAFDGSTYLVASSDYVIRNNDGIILLKQTSTHGAWSDTDETETIKAVYTAGWSTIPADIKQACVMLVSQWWKLRGTMGLSAMTVQDATASPRDEFMPTIVRDMLDPYRIGESLI